MFKSIGGSENAYTCLDPLSVLMQRLELCHFRGVGNQMINVELSGYNVMETRAKQ